MYIHLWQIWHTCCNKRYKRENLLLCIVHFLFSCGSVTCVCERKRDKRKVCLISKQRMCLFRAAPLNSERRLPFTSARAHKDTQKTFSKKPICGCFRRLVQIFVHLLTCDVMMDVNLSLKSLNGLPLSLCSLYFDCSSNSDSREMERLKVAVAPGDVQV